MALTIFQFFILDPSHPRPTQGSLREPQGRGRYRELPLSSTVAPEAPSRDSVQPGRYYNKVWCCRVPAACGHRSQLAAACSCFVLNLDLFSTP
jgi:hypothetical protein